MGVMSEFAAMVGWDWADREHEVRLREVGQETMESATVRGSAEALHSWAAAMLERFGGRRIAVAIDAGRGAVISAFMGYPHIVLFPINPKAASDLRQALHPSGKKDDPVDSETLLEMIEKHGDRLRPLRPADPATRELGMLSEFRKKLDNDRKREVNRLRDVLKSFYPQAVELFPDGLSTPMVCDFLETWPTLQRLKRAQDRTLVSFFRDHRCRSEKRIDERLVLIRASVPLTGDSALIGAGEASVLALVVLIRSFMAAIAQVERKIAAIYRAHVEYELIDSFPGLGEALGPRVLAVLGSDRDRFATDEALQRFSGVAPVTKQTGGRRGPITIHRRIRRPKFIHQTMIEFAGCSIPHSAWAKAFYDMKTEQYPEASHYTILRALAYKWMRILFRCWQARTPYDEARYQMELARRGSPVAKRLALAA